MSGEDLPFLSRWSRLKRRVTLEREAPAAPATPETAVVPQAGSAGAPPAATGTSEDYPPALPAGDAGVVKQREEAEEPVDLSKLPSIDSLGRDSDYSMFMRKGVPQDLRMKALRRMWLTDPVLAGPEIVDMYAYDYTGLDGHKPLVRPAMEAVAAVAKAVRKKGGAESASAPSRNREGPTPAAPPQGVGGEDEASEDERPGGDENVPDGGAKG